MAVKKTTPTKSSSLSSRKSTPSTNNQTSVIVKEKSIEKDFCGSSNGSCNKMSKIMMMVLLAINTILLIVVLVNCGSGKSIFNALEKFEAVRVGGEDNYSIIKEIYELDSYKVDQNSRLKTTLDFLKNPNAMNDLNAVPQEMPQELQEMN